VYAYYEQKEELLKSIAGALKTEEGQILKKIEHVFDENKQLHAEIEASKSKAAGNAAADIISQAETVGDIKVLSARVDGADMNALRTLGDTVRDKLGECAIFLASESDGKVSLIAMATEKAIAKGAHSGNLIKSVAACVGGSGGGKPAMAQAGGKNPAGIGEAVEQAWSKLRAVN
jgi:alanyl-tRNA synthetase